MMIMITKPRGKLKLLAVGGLTALLLGVALPLGYTTLTDAGAMSLFAAGENVTGGANVSDSADVSESADVGGETDDGGLWSEVRRVVFGEEMQVIRY